MSATINAKSPHSEANLTSNKVYTEMDFRAMIVRSFPTETNVQLIVKKITPHFFRVRFIKTTPCHNSILDDLSEIGAFVVEIIETATGLDFIKHLDRKE